MTIHRVRIPENNRLAITEALFGIQWPLRIEPLIFHIAGTIAPAYNGGFWTFHRLPMPEGDDGFYMAPDADKPFEVFCEANYWSGELSADAFGVVCCMTAYSHLSFSRDAVFGRLMTQHFHRLRAFAVEHPEAAEILGATD